MNIVQGYRIMDPFNLPWRFVSPANYKGLEYHLSPNLSLKLEGLYRSTVKVDEKGKPVSETQEIEFCVGNDLLWFENFDVDKLNAERVFINEIFATKSQERINKAFADKNGILSVFFTERQMEFFQESFESTFFVCSKVTVVFNGKEIDDPVELPPADYKLVLEAFDVLHVVGILDHSENREVLQDRYVHFYEKKVAKEEDRQKQKLWDKVKNKETKRDLVKAFGSLAIGVAGLMLRRKLANAGGVFFGFVGVIIGAVSIGFELYGRQQTNNALRSL